MKIVHDIIQSLSLKRCKGCEDTEPHSHHMTRFGHWRYVDRYK